MSQAATSHECLQCAVLRRQIAELESRLAKLEKNSTNSSKPPSSDFVKPAAALKKSRKNRKPGGQPGHPKHERIPFTEQQIDRQWDYSFDRCPDCAGKLKRLEQPASIVQQVEIVTRPIHVSEDRSPPKGEHPSACSARGVPFSTLRAVVGPQGTARRSHL